MGMLSQVVRIGVLVSLLAPLGASAQAGTPADQEEVPPAAPESARAPNAAQPIPFPDARVAELRDLLDKTSDGDARYRLFMQLSSGYFTAGRVADSLRVREEIVNDSAISPGRRSITASSLALSLALAREFQRSERMVDRAKSLAKDTPPAELETLPREPAYAYLAAEAEIARRHLNRHDIAYLKYREHAELAWSNFNDPTLSEKRRRAAANEVLNNVSNVARLMVQNNRRAEALSYANEMAFYLDTRPDLHPSEYARGLVAHARAIALCSYDDYDAALEAINSALAHFEKGGTPEHETSYADALRLRLMIALSMGRIAEFVPDAEAVQRARAIDPVTAGAFAGEETESLGMAAHGQWANASSRISEIIAKYLRAQGPESPFYKYESSMLVLYRLDDPTNPATLGELESYVAPLASSDDTWADASTRGVYTEDGALTAALDRLMQPGAFPEAAGAQALAFRIAELMRMNASQGALTDGAARLAAGDPKLRALIEQEQVLRFEETSARGSVSSASVRLERLAKKGEADPIILKRQNAELAEKEKALQASTGKLVQLRRDIASQFPIYRELVAPSIPTSEKLGAALRRGEVYVNLYAGRHASFAFVVLPSGELHAVRLTSTRAQLKQMAQALRRSFDSGTPPATPGDLGGFDLAAAQGLYQALIAPIQNFTQGAGTVYIAASGPLSVVPWNVLLTRPAKTLAEANWWISSVTPVQMPSASALVLARSPSGQAAKRAGLPFIAFADPSFDGQDHAPLETSSAGSIRQRAIRGGEGRLVEIDYHNVAPLPETFDEVRAIGAALNAAPDSVIRGTQATRTRVLKEDLSDRRVVTFATHGLLPGEVPGMLKSGLALAYEGRGLADSVLTIDDIIGLRLNADWVVLSACNTGFASGAAGDTLSTLSRGFFAAGARSLLATQWAVESESAKELTVNLFKVYAGDPAVTKAEAIARAQRDMLAGKDGALYRHPYFWAPYFLAGDAGR